MSMTGRIAEGRAWAKREGADALAVAVYVAARWPLLDAENRKWMVEKIMEGSKE